MDDNEANFTLKSCDEVQAICNDFFTYSGISYFNFVRIYDDGSRISLTNTYDWSSFFIKEHKKYKLIFEEKTKHAQSGCLIWDLIEGIREDELMTIARDKFDIDHGITLIKKHEGFMEFYYFATSKNNNQINIYYTNHQEELLAFALYFKDKAAAIIKNAEEQQYLLEGHPLYWLDPSIKKNENEFKKKDFFDKNPIEKYYLNGKLKNLYLSAREAECLAYLYDGTSPKSIAKKLDISFRTVEGYIDKVKNKLGCKYRDDLLKVARDHGFQEIYEVILSRNKV